MLYRIKQFFRGIFVCVPPESGILIKRYLNKKEYDLFMKLPPYERAHALNTAFTVQGFGDIDNKEIIVKAALLHDIGKVGSGIGIFGKSILVLTDKFFPDFSHKLSQKIDMFKIYYKHPEIGAKLLESIGTDKKVILLVENHHSNKYIKGIEYLKKADSLN
ncbi:MAG: HDIG domain-containing protein [Clostridiales bacterium]|nr:HDIG domain-containing protein [Clostridiales bacterium]